MAQITGSQLSLFEYPSPFQEIIKVETKSHCIDNHKMHQNTTSARWMLEIVTLVYTERLAW